MATRMSRKSKSGDNFGLSPAKQTHLSPKGKALPTILSDTSPQEEEVVDEVKRRSRRSGADSEDGQDQGKQRPRRGEAGRGARDESLLQEGESLTVRNIYR